MSEDRGDHFTRKIFEKYGVGLWDLDKCRAIQKKCQENVDEIKQEVTV